MNLQNRLSVFFLYLIIVSIQLSQVFSQNGPERNTQWLEDQIDKFITKAEQNGEPTDLQISSCKISGQQLVATAQATIARALKGVCNTGEFEDKFHNLGTQLGEQLNVIKTMVISLENKVIELDQAFKRQEKRSQVRGLYESNPSVTSINGNHLTTQYTRQIQSNLHTYPNEHVDDLNPVEEGSNFVTNPRFDEVNRYNSTVSIENGRRVFSFYWIVSGMNYKLNSWTLRRSFVSSPFYIFHEGYRMYLKIIPRYTQSTMYVHTGLMKGEFDEILSWPFQLKLRISILSMENPTGTDDLKSRIWDPKKLCSGTNWMKPVRDNNPECLGLGFPHELIKTSEYLHMDKIIIKLSVYLD